MDSGQKKKWIIAVVGLVLLVLAFYAGAKYEKNKLGGAGLLKSANTGASRQAGVPKAPKTTTPGTQAAGSAQGAAGSQKTTTSTTTTTTPSTTTAPAAPSASATGTGTAE